MKRTSNILLAIAFVIFLALGAVQGRRLNHLRESESFYRWLLSQAIQERVLGDDQDPDAPKLMDRELLDEVSQAAEPLLSNVQVTGSDVAADGKPLSRLMLLARDGQHDTEIWNIARSKELSQQRGKFLQYLRERKLTSVASQFDAKANYASGGASVGLGNIVFGFRMLAANLVWLQVDKYWHQGMTHRMIPLMNTCVTLDPQFVDAFLIGAWHLAYNITAKMPDTPEPLKKLHPKYKVRLGQKEIYYYMAVDFLKDGIRKNPRNYKLYFDLGFSVYKQKLKDYANAVRYLSEAMRHRHDKWVPRQLYICMELNGQYEEALVGWKDYFSKYPDNVNAPRFITRTEGMIKEAQAKRLSEEAATEQDAAKADVLRQQSAQAKEEARKIWEKMIADYREDPFAQGRLLRMKAMDLIREERHLEAVAILEHARLLSSDFFEEASWMIIDAKKKAGIPLSVSEKKAVERKQEAERFTNEVPQ